MPEASEREPSNNYKVCIVTTTAKLKNVGRGGGRLGVWEGFLVGLEKQYWQKQNAPFCLQLKKGPWQVFFNFIIILFGVVIV